VEAPKGTAYLESLPKLWTLATRVKRGAWRERTEGGEPLSTRDGSPPILRFLTSKSAICAALIRALSPS
jgi:hypothetical protein